MLPKAKAWVKPRVWRKVNFLSLPFSLEFSWLTLADPSCSSMTCLITRWASQRAKFVLELPLSALLTCLRFSLWLLSVCLFTTSHSWPFNLKGPDLGFLTAKTRVSKGDRCFCSIIRADITAILALKIRYKWDFQTNIRNLTFSSLCLWSST